MRRAVFLDRVAAHYRNAGWHVEVQPTLEDSPRPFQPDLLIRKGALKQAVLFRDENPPGPFELGRFAAECKKRKLRGVVIYTDDPVLVDLCEQMGLDYLPSESIGEVVVVGEAPPPPPLVSPRPAPVPAPVPVAPVSAPPATIPGWRWTIVALIWLAALLAVAYDVYLFTR